MREIGILSPNNPCQHRTLHIQKDPLSDKLLGVGQHLARGVLDPRPRESEML
jgi:hypothetical protein